MRPALFPRFLAILGFVFLLSDLAWCQQRDRGIRPVVPRQITGRVRDARTNVPVTGAIVELQGDLGDSVEQTVVGSAGRFQFTGIDARRYYLVARAAGYRLSPRIPVDLTFSPQQNTDLTMQPDPDSTGTAAAKPGAGVLPVVGLATLAIPEKAKQEFAKAEAMMANPENRGQTIEHLQKAMQLYPKYVEAYHLLGTIYMDAGKWPDAEKMLRHAIEINDRFAPSYFALGALLNTQRKPRDAEKELEKGLQADPNSWLGHAEISRSYFAAGALAKAKEHALRAHELNASEPVVHLTLADVYVGEGAYSEARTEYQHFLAAAPQSPWAPKVREKIKELEAFLPQQKKPSPQ